MVSSLQPSQMIGGVEIGKIVLRRATEDREAFGDFDGLLVFAFAFRRTVRLEHRAAQRDPVMGL